MRRSAWTLLAGFVVGAVGGTADAQPFGFLFGGQPHPYRRTRTVRGRPASAPAAVPLPVPRPHFASDPARSAPDSVAGAPSAVPAPSSEPPKPDEAAIPPPVGETTAPPSNAPPPNPPMPVPKPADLVAPPPGPGVSPGAAPTPPVAPSGATNAFNPRQPTEDAACFDRLKAAQANFEPVSLAPQPDPRCTVVQPVRLTGLTLPDGGTVAFPDHPTIACTTADTFSTYVHQMLAPLAKGSFGSALTTVWTGPGLECRSRDHIFGAKLSAHGQGLAVDIAQIKLADGRSIEVGTPKTEVDTAFETAARAGGCGYFHTVLGPGSDSYHRTHWHFDLEVRGRQGDSKYCK